MTKFYERVRDQQVTWRRRMLTEQTPGRHNGRQHDHVLPLKRWDLNLWPRIAGDLTAYLRENAVQPHTGKHNLCSSWILCANLYFPFRQAAGCAVLAAFLREELSLDVSSVKTLDLEYEHREPALQPSALLGEDQGARGSGQTSPDIAFEVTTSSGATGLILVESKYTEHSFYECSGHRSKTKGRPSNQNRARCDDLSAVVHDPDNQCHLTTWGRRYWQHLHFNDTLAGQMISCPAAHGGYQLFRQQALAEALATTNRWALVVSSVAFDERNNELFRVLRTRDGVLDARSAWSQLLRLKAPFVTFTHQQWVAWVRTHGGSAWNDWLEYVHNRYGF